MYYLRSIFILTAIITIVSCKSQKKAAVSEYHEFPPCAGNQKHFQEILRWQVELSVSDTLSNAKIDMVPAVFKEDTLRLAEAIVNNYKIPPIVKEMTAPHGAKYYYLTSLDSLGKFTPLTALRRDKIADLAGKELMVVLNRIQLLNDTTWNRPYAIMMRLKVQ